MAKMTLASISLPLYGFLAKKRGRATLLAKRLGVSPALISMWANGTRRIPAERVWQIREYTGLSPKQLRPDIFTRRKKS